MSILKQLLGRLQQASTEQAARRDERAVQKEMERIGAETVAYARVNAPFNTGFLRDSIGYRIVGDQIVLEATAPYAPFVEYGTGSRGENPTGPYVIRPRNARALRFEKNGKVIFAKKVTHPGNWPRPFLRPALRYAAGIVRGRA